MSKKINQMITQKGSMMVEALAMLGLITMVTPVLYKKAAERTTELQDINTAAQMRTMSKALDDYVKDNYIELTKENTDKVWTVAAEDIAPYLPYGFNMEDSKLFSGYKMAIKRVFTPGETASGDHSSITGMVVAPVKDSLPGIRSAKIASMIGANGSVYKKCSGPDGTAKAQFCGVQGGWFATPDEYEVSGFEEGSIGSISLHAINASSGAGSDHVLFRDNTMGDESYNTMATNLSMGGWSIDQVHRLIALSDDGGTGEVLIAGNDEGEGAKDANLIVQGMAQINKLLMAGSANIAGSFTVGEDGAVSAGNKVTVTSGGLDVTGDTNLKNTKVTGTATVTEKLTAEKAAEVKGGLTVSGIALTADGNDYGIVDEGSLLVKKNARITGDLYVGGKFEADKVYGNTELGGGKLADNSYNLLATKDHVTIQGRNFVVADRLQTTETYADMGVGTVSVGANADQAYVKANDTNRLDVSNGALTAKTSGTLTAQAGAGGKLTLTNDGLLEGQGAILRANNASGVAQVEGPTAKLISGNNVVLTDSAGARMSATAGADVRTLNLNSDGMGFGDGAADANLKMYADLSRLSFGQNAKSIGVDGNGVVNNGVLVRREGMINLPRSATVTSTNSAAEREASSSGYVKLDRIVGNVAYEAPWASGSKDYNALVGKPVSQYDAYQVNPAYTSVMHDIKLTTRGNARLSDVLPDFINKGIYVIDNTYAEPKTNSNWEKYTVSVSGGKVYVKASPSYYSESGLKSSPVTDMMECNNADCITSPWLGFVPTPQCPPGYSKVITINPIRWKMAEAYMIAMDPTGETDIAKKFKSFFIAPRAPAKAKFALSEVTASTSAPHTHEVPSGSGEPLTFQTNTWLNTTISGVRNGSTAGDSGNVGTVRNGDFLGWHAIMGFLYHGSDYRDYLDSLPGSPGAALDGKIVWNLFPVYNEEMTAIANVYCYFERRSMTSEPVWSWKGNIVNNDYDQLINFRAGFDKNDGYVSRLNDSNLKYDDPW